GTARDRSASPSSRSILRRRSKRRFPGIRWGSTRCRSRVSHSAGQGGASCVTQSGISWHKQEDRAMATVRDVGEKQLIEDTVKRVFDGDPAPAGVGDDCAVLPLPADSVLLATTDRVPADLIARRLGLMDSYGLGRYLACLNLSDIAACGGRPAGLLFNAG